MRKRESYRSNGNGGGWRRGKGEPDVVPDNERTCPNSLSLSSICVSLTTRSISICVFFLPFPSSLLPEHPVGRAQEHWPLFASGDRGLVAAARSRPLPLGARSAVLVLVVVLVVLHVGQRHEHLCVPRSRSRALWYRRLFFIIISISIIIVCCVFTLICGRGRRRGAVRSVGRANAARRANGRQQSASRRAAIAHVGYRLGGQR
jgi:hypothetical protein